MISRRVTTVALATLFTSAVGVRAGHAEPLRLRGDALASTHAPAGLLVLQGDDRVRPWLSAEALVWVGAGGEAEADALAISVSLRDPGGLGTLRLGRQVMVVGALRPVHADGAVALVRLPWQGTVEAFGGLPVVPGFGPRAYDWLVGARAAQRLGPARLGLAWMQRRDAGSLDTHELGLDGALLPDGPWDLAVGGAWDLISPGLAELRVSTAWRRRGWRVEIFGTHRSAAHLLPATSLFSVLGDVPSQRGGLVWRWRAAPRLDVWVGAGGSRLDDDLGVDLSVRGLLRLDDRGAGALGLELRRDGAPDGAWTGVRATYRRSLGGAWGVASELELVFADDDATFSNGLPRERGVVWPWALAAVTWRPARAWEVAGAVEAGASPEDVYRVHVLARVSRAWELP